MYQNRGTVGGFGRGLGLMSPPPKTPPADISPPLPPGIDMEFIQESIEPHYRWRKIGPKAKAHAIMTAHSSYAERASDSVSPGQIIEGLLGAGPHVGQHIHDAVGHFIGWIRECY